MAEEDRREKCGDRSSSLSTMYTLHFYVILGDFGSDVQSSWMRRNGLERSSLVAN